MSGQLMPLFMTCILLIIVLVLHGICLSMPYYAEAPELGRALSDIRDLESYRAYYPNMDTKYGFWEICVNMKGSTKCYSFGLKEDASSNTFKAPDWVIACQVLSIIGLTIGAIALIFCIFFLKFSKTFLLVACSICSITGGIIIIIADVVFAGEKSIKFFFQSDQMNFTFGSPKDKYLVAADDAFQYGWAFGLDIATGIMCILIGILFVILSVLRKSDRFYLTKM
uniref:Uncharacterized protein n=1 Tax=Arion vulgaris TaxID=1028688 RepID=A0A0B7A2K7_9EUPU